jgi:hypothetical protein
VAAAKERTRALRLSIPEEARSALKLFSQFRRSELKRDATQQVASKPSLPQIKRLLKRRIYRNWFFDAGDLYEADVPLPRAGKPSRRWLNLAASKLDSPSVRIRIVAMAEHMHEWHNYRGETQLADLCMAAAQSTETDFVESALVRGMLERTCEMVQKREEKDISVFGSPEIRQGLKSKFFKNLKSPKGKHMALLDFTEVVLSSMDNVLSLIPGERRPRDEDKPIIAYTISKSFLDFIIDNTDKSLDEHVLALARSLRRRCRLTGEECYEIGFAVTLELISFMDEVCSHCPGSCTTRPHSNAADIFFSPHHPVDLFLGGYRDDDSR